MLACVKMPTAANDFVLRSTPPRKLLVRKGSGWRWTVIFRCLFWINLFVAACLWFCVAVLILWTYRGTNLNGHVLDRYIVHAKGYPAAFEVKYEYTYKGILRVSSNSVSMRTYNALSLNSLVQVRVYGFRSFHYAELLDPVDKGWSTLAVAIEITTTCTFPVALLYLGAYQRPRRERQLLVWGRAARGIVISRHEVRGRTTIRTDLRYEFKLKNGRRVEANWSGGPPFEESLKVGDAVTVFHMPGKAKPNVIYEVCMYRIVE